MHRASAAGLCGPKTNEPQDVRALIIVVAVLSPAGSAVTPVGVTSQVMGKFKSLDQCKADIAVLSHLVVTNGSQAVVRLHLLVSID